MKRKVKRKVAGEGKKQNKNKLWEPSKTKFKRMNGREKKKDEEKMKQMKSSRLQTIQSIQEQVRYQKKQMKRKN